GAQSDHHGSPQAAAEPHDISAGSHSRTEQHAPSITPNAPSEPVWGFGSDQAAVIEERTKEPIGDVYYRREEVNIDQTSVEEPEHSTEKPRASHAEHIASASGATEPSSE